MGPNIHLIVEDGPDRGREITVPPDGARIGRSSKNDIVLIDPSLSRFHCRILFKPGEGLWAADLGSSNQTLVNRKPIQEVQLRVGDRISVGDTVMKVVSTDVPPPAPAAAATPVLPPVAASRRDFESDASAERPRARPGDRSRRRRRLIVAAVIMAVVAAGVWVGNPGSALTKLAGLLGRSPQTALVPPAPDQTPRFELQYEKVTATPSNIFRYYMEIKGALVIQIDDLQNKRHVPREKKVEPELLQSLGKSIENAGFFDLLDEYQGVAPNIYDAWDISVTMGRKTHRTRVINRVEPEGFRAVREMIEEFGRNELGLAALALEPEKLIELAREALVQGRKFYDEREIRNENLALAIRSFREAEWYLETIEPKPDFYSDAVGRRADCERERNDKYENLRFLAERAVKLRDWREAARHLRVIREMIPDRADDRNKNASLQLVDVERHLAPERP